MENFLEQAFGKNDVTTPKMRAAVREWFDLYYGAPRPQEDTALRPAALIVGKLCRTVFAEYEARLPADTAPARKASLAALDRVAKTALQYAMIGGECLLKPVPQKTGFAFAALRRDCYVPLARDAHGQLLAVGTMEILSVESRRYALLERRTAGADGLTIETRLFELNGQTLGRCVPLNTLPVCADLVPQLVLPGVPGVGLAVLRMPLVNCVDGSADAVSLYAPATGLLHALARLEALPRDGGSHRRQRRHADDPAGGRREVRCGAFADRRGRRDAGCAGYTRPADRVHLDQGRRTRRRHERGW